MATQQSSVITAARRHARAATYSVHRYVPLRLAALVLFAASAASAQERVLTQAIEVRSLSPAEAERGIPARLRGVVIFVEGVSAIFIQDETSTAFFRLRTPPLPRVGDEIELVSRTRMGLYLPGLDVSSYRVVGRRPLPPGIPAQYDDLHFGRYHYQRVTVEGIVRSIAPLDAEKSLMRLAMGSRVIEVRVEQPPPARSLVDHRVRVTGLAAGMINTPRRQLIQPSMRVVDWSEVETVAPAPPASGTPQISAEELLAFRVSGLGEQRVRIAGTVSAVFSREQVFLQQDAHAFAVRFGQPTPLAPGDRVTVLGFPSMEQFSASVVDAELVERQAGAPPSPIDVPSLDELYSSSGNLHGRFDGFLVRVVVTLRDAFKTEGGAALLVQDGKRTIQARVPEGIDLPPVGSRLRLTGICLVESAVHGAGFASRPDLLSLRVTSPAGFEVLRRPSWWTPQRLSSVLAMLAGLTLVAGLWIAALRRQVARQTAALRERIQSEAALAERQRIAREFHDTLEQELAGVSLRLDALATRPLDDKGRNLIAAARNLVSRIQTETRDLISDLRDATETAGDLPAALASVAARQSADTGAEVRFESLTIPPTLPAAVVHDLRMIARESVTNALKHGRATHVRIELERRASALLLRVTDNGCGFDPASAADIKRGHFGCAGIRERSRKIGAEVAWRSELQRGTTVEVSLPWPEPETPPAPPSPDPAAPVPAADPDRRSEPAATRVSSHPS